MIYPGARGIILRGLLFCGLLLFLCAPWSHAAGTCAGASLTITGPDAPVNGSQYVASGGTAPYSWCIGKGSISSNGVVTVSGHCGTATITVWDSCGNIAKKTVRMPDAQWVLVENYHPVPTYNCGCIGTQVSANGLPVDDCRAYGDTITHCESVDTKWSIDLCPYRKGFDAPCAPPPFGVQQPRVGISSLACVPAYSWTQVEEGQWGVWCTGHYSWEIIGYSKYEWRSPTCNEPEATCVKPFDFKIDYFKGPVDLPGQSVPISPTAGGSYMLSGHITDNYGKTVSWTVTLAGRTYPGSGSTVSVTWDGKDSDGKVVEKNRTYTATLSAWNSCGCSVSKDLKMTVVDPPPNTCGLLVKFGSSANVASGNLSHSQELFSTKGGALPLVMTLYYNSLDPINGAVGWGWSHSYDISLTKNADGAVVLLKEPNWQSRVYTLVNGAYVGPVGDYSALVMNGDGTFTLTRKEGTRYSFGTDGKITSIVDRNGNTVAFVYTGGNLTAATDPAGRQATLAYDGNNHLTSVTDPSGKVYTFSHNGSLLSTVAYPGGGVWDYTYDDKAFMLTKSDPLGEITTYAYDGNHRVVSSVDPEGKARSIGYPPGTETVKSTVFTEQDGGVWSYTYDTWAGTLAQKVDPQRGVTSYTYDASGNRTSVTDPAGATTSYSYDGQGNMTAMTDPAGQTTSYTYNTFAQVLISTDPQGNTTSYAYDAKGNFTAMTEVAGATTSYEYDVKGNATKVINPAGQVTTFAYDAGGNLISATDPTGAATTSVYDASGNLLSRTDALDKTTTFTYDSTNQLLTVTDPLGNTTTYTYDLSGNRTSQTDANGNTTSYEYNSQGQLVRETDALGNATTYAYGGAGCPSCGSGGAGKLTGLSDAKGQTTAWQYDNLGRLVQETDPLRQATLFGYDLAGNLVQKTDANGAAIVYSYDPLKRLTGKTYPDGSAVSYSYDAVGRISTMANGEVSYSYVYDAAGRMTSATDSRGYVLAYEYDILGNRSKMTFQPGKVDERVTTYAYYAGNRLTGITSPAGTFTHGYDALGRRTSLVYPNQATATYAYDDGGRLTSLSHVAGGSAIAVFSYVLDKVGNRTSKTTTAAEDYLYDVVYRLLNVVSPKPEAFTYDAVGNRQAGPGAKDTAYLYNIGNQMLFGRKLQYGYDNNGNQMARTVPDAADKSWAHYWDQENRLVKMERKKGSETRTVTFRYDPAGRRIGMQMVIVKGGVTKTETYGYVYDNDNIALEIYTDNDRITEKTLYTHGAGIDDHLALERNGRFYYYHADGLGSVVRITDASRNVVQSYEYDSFGMAKPSTNFRNSYTYTGREWDKEAGLYYYRARYYDPMEGRFVSKDPITLKNRTQDQLNSYTYAINNPINFTDPNGENIYGNWCGPGGKGSTKDGVDVICKKHDKCFDKTGATWRDNMPIVGTSDKDKKACMDDCNKQLCDDLRSYMPTTYSEIFGRSAVMSYFRCSP